MRIMQRKLKLIRIHGASAGSSCALKAFKAIQSSAHVVHLHYADDPPVRPLVPKRGEGVHSNKKQLLQEDPQIELRLLDEETLEAPASCDNQSQSRQPSPETDLKCQLVIAFLGLLALVPLVGIVIYLVGMFYGVPPTTNFESSSIQADQETTTKDQTMTTTIVY